MRIAIDFTPFHPETTDDDAVAAALGTLRCLQSQPDHELVLLTASWNHDILLQHECANIRLVCVAGEGFDIAAAEQHEPAPVLAPSPVQCAVSRKRRLWNTLKRPIKAVLPSSALRFLGQHKAGIKRRIFKLIHPVEFIIKPFIKKTARVLLPSSLRQKIKKYCAASPSASTAPAAPSPAPKSTEPQCDLASMLGQSIDVLLCPFTDVRFHDEQVLTVSVIHSMRHRLYPGFYSASELQSQERMYQRIQKLKPHIVAVSQYAKNAFLADYPYDQSLIRTIYPPFNSSIDHFTLQETTAALERMGLAQVKYCYYPARFDEHKNHRLLFIAFRMYLEQNPQSPLKLVISGKNAGCFAQYQDTLQRMGLSDRIICLEQDSDTDNTILMQNCDYVIYPSLVEGFCMTIAAAMKARAAMICSNNTSFPEVAGDCAVYCDPRSPDSILQAMVYMDEHPQEVEQKKAMYEKQLSQFRSQNHIAQYREMFSEGVRA